MIFWMASLQMNVPESVTNQVAMTADERKWYNLRGQYCWNIFKEYLKFWKF